MSSPTQRSLEYMRRKGYLCAVVERYNHFVKRKNDLFGFIDIICVGENEVIGVQATSATNVSSRITKIAEHENVAAVRRGGIRILVHGWAKRKSGRWEVREVDVS